MASPTRAFRNSSLPNAARNSKTVRPPTIPRVPDPNRLLASAPRDLRPGEDPAEKDAELKLIRSGAPAPKRGFEEGDAGLGVVWQKLSKLRRSEQDLGSLISAVIQFANANCLQDTQAFLRRGGELPEHVEMKAELGKQNDTRSKELLKAIAVAEADRGRWTERKVTAWMSAMVTTLTEMISTPSLYTGALWILDDELLRALRLRFLNRQPQPTQAALHHQLRKDALERMVAAMPKKSPHWALLSDLVFEASGKKYTISAATLRQEYAAVASVSSTRKRGVLTVR